MHAISVVVPPKHPLTQPTELQASQGDEESPSIVHWVPSVHTIVNIYYYKPHIYSNKYIYIHL